jgi:predicted transposase YbfD/YdcC
VHEVQQVALPDGYLGWTHARQLVRVVRTVTANDGTTTTGQRYYVCSQTRRGITAEEAIKLSRYHWRCENDGHWTSDAILEEDARRTVGSRHPGGMLVFALLRMIAQNVMAVLRATSITDSKTRPTWKAVGEHILKAVFPYGIESSVFDDVQSVVSAA